MGERGREEFSKQVQTGYQGSIYMVPSWRPLGIAPGERGRQGGREGERRRDASILRPHF